MYWIRRNLRNNTVYIRANRAGEPEIGSDGRVEIVYHLHAGSTSYRAAPRNLVKTGNPDDERPVEADAGGQEPNRPVDQKKQQKKADKRANPRAGAPTEAGPDDIVIYTDGACTGNPGPMGLGVVIRDCGECREISEFLGHGTNNIAELTAIERALESLPDADRDRKVLLHTDSSYSIGVLSKGWKAKANRELIARIKVLLTQFSDLKLIHVRGHAGIPDNERCDALGREAISRGR